MYPIKTINLIMGALVWHTQGQGPDTRQIIILHTFITKEAAKSHLYVVFWPLRWVESKKQKQIIILPRFITAKKSFIVVWPHKVFFFFFGGGGWSQGVTEKRQIILLQRCFSRVAAKRPFIYSGLVTKRREEGVEGTKTNHHVTYIYHLTTYLTTKKERHFSELLKFCSKLHIYISYICSMYI